MASNPPPNTATPSDSGSSFWSSTWNILSMRWLWSSSRQATPSFVPPIPPGRIYMVVRDRTEPPNWGGMVNCNCSDVEKFWSRWLLGQSPPTSASWVSVEPEPAGNPLRRFWSEMRTPNVERPSQISQLWKQTQVVEDKETGDSCAATLYVRDIEMFLSRGNQWQLPRRGPPSILWLSSPPFTPLATTTTTDPRISKQATIFKPIPNSSTTWKQGWTWKPVPGLTQLPETNWFAELSTEKYDRERLVRELEAANGNLEKTAWQMERTAMSLAGIAPGIAGLTAALTGLGVEMDRVRRKMDRVARRVEEQEEYWARRSGPGSRMDGFAAGTAGGRVGREEAPPAYSPSDPWARR